MTRSRKISDHFDLILTDHFDQGFRRLSILLLVTFDDHWNLI